MLLRKLFPYFIQGVALSLVIGLGVVVIARLKPFEHHPTVEIKQVASSAQPAQNTAATGTYSGAVTIAAPAVVNVNTTKTLKRSIHPFFNDPEFRRFFGDRLPPDTQEQTSLGSGVIVSKQGYIITNNHVIDGADEITVSLNDGRSAPAVVIGTDPESDIAVLKVTLDGIDGIAIGNSDTLQVGDIVLAIGNPFGVGQTVTQGIVSATGRNHLGLSTFENFIQTDAAINPGNSGGALINLNGELIGINTAIFSRSGGSQGIGFAIPSALARSILTQLIEQGHVVRGWMGIETQAVTPALAESFGLTEAKGVIVAGVERNGPGARAGLKSGDVITAIEDHDIGNTSDVLDYIANSRPGDDVHIRIMRERKALTLTVTLGTRPSPGN